MRIKKKSFYPLLCAVLIVTASTSVTAGVGLPEDSFIPIVFGINTYEATIPYYNSDLEDIAAVQGPFEYNCSASEKVYSWLEDHLASQIRKIDEILKWTDEISKIDDIEDKENFVSKKDLFSRHEKEIEEILSLWEWDRFTIDKFTSYVVDYVIAVETAYIFVKNIKSLSVQSTLEQRLFESFLAELNVLTLFPLEFKTDYVNYSNVEKCSLGNKLSNGFFKKFERAATRLKVLATDLSKKDEEKKDSYISNILDGLCREKWDELTSYVESGGISIYAFDKAVPLSNRELDEIKKYSSAVVLYSPLVKVCGNRAPDLEDYPPELAASEIALHLAHHIYSEFILNVTDDMLETIESAVKRKDIPFALAMISWAERLLKSLMVFFPATADDFAASLAALKGEMYDAVPEMPWYVKDPLRVPLELLKIPFIKFEKSLKIENKALEHVKPASVKWMRGEDGLKGYWYGTADDLRIFARRLRAMEYASLLAYVLENHRFHGYGFNMVPYHLIEEQCFDKLESRGVMSDDEWHETSLEWRKNMINDIKYEMRYTDKRYYNVSLSDIGWYEATKWIEYSKNFAMTEDIESSGTEVFIKVTYALDGVPTEILLEYDENENNDGIKKNDVRSLVRRWLEKRNDKEMIEISILDTSLTMNLYKWDPEKRTFVAKETLISAEIDKTQNKTALKLVETDEENSNITELDMDKINENVLTERAEITENLILNCVKFHYGVIAALPEEMENQ